MYFTAGRKLTLKWLKITGWTVRNSNPGKGKRFISTPKRQERLLGPPNLIFNGFRYYLRRLRRPERDFDLSLPCRVKVKNKWKYTSDFHASHHGLDRETSHFTFTYTMLSLLISDMGRRRVSAVSHEW